jgi:hypothetical protein
MEISESIEQIKTILEENGLDVDKASKAQHWLYRSGSKIERYVDHELIMSISEESKRDLYRLCDDLSFIKERIGNMEKIVVNELNYRVLGTAEHTREWW